MTARPPNPGRAEPSWPFPEAGRYVRVDGARWHLVHLGSGPPLLLIHGSASSAHQWDRVARLLETRLSLIIPDLPGHGYSLSSPPGRSGLEAVASQLGRLLRQEGISPLLVAGHSAGACIAIRAAARGWISPRAILALAPALGSRDTYVPPLLDRPMAALARSGLLARGAAGVIRNLPVVEQLLRSTGSRLDPEVRSRYRALLSNPRRVAGALALFSDWDPSDVAADAARLGIPVTVLAGEEDQWVPPATIRESISRALLAHPEGQQSLQLRFEPKLGHLLPEEAPELVADCLLELAERAGILPAATGD